MLAQIDFMDRFAKSKLDQWNHGCRGGNAIHIKFNLFSFKVYGETLASTWVAESSSHSDIESIETEQEYSM
ncbi:hypothetical protein K7432_008918 [Basidiobolus ranarum]|uniref:Uncharacterized protein n=1 Tax=Basidiobolus ranarum TaxID=34480 RepID=A0ABR2WR22_9FUNG